MQRRSGADGINPALRRASEYTWRVLLIGVTAYAVFLVAVRFEPILLALTAALVLTALLGPAVGSLNRFVPRWLAVLGVFVLGLAVVGGLGFLAVRRVADQAGTISADFRSGVGRVDTWLQNGPLHIRSQALNRLPSQVSSYVRAHQSALIGQVLNGAGEVAGVLAMAAFAIFCFVFFAHSGERMWAWFRQQMPERVRPDWQRCGAAAWRTFAGYSRGIVLVAAVNAAMVGIALTILRVPLVLPLVMLEFLASFVPYIGSPIAMALATLVALTTRGIVTAVIVLGLIVLFGQIEGHVLHPLVMGWSVRLHPVVVATSVLAGTVAAGLVGAIAAVPLVSVAWAVVQELRRTTDPQP